jgi:hypothetical protein
LNVPTKLVGDAMATNSKIFTSAGVGWPGPRSEDIPYSLPVGAPFQRFGGPSRSTQYELDKAGEIKTFLVGNRRYVIVQSWLDYVARQRAKEEARRAAGIRPLMRGEVR